MAAAQTKVLVTGATGFIGSWCTKLLLEQGFVVRGTVRSLANEAKLRHLRALSEANESRLELVTASLDTDDGWGAAVEGCKFVLHVASPFPLEEPEHEDELIKPARDGALRVLRAAAASTSVERVVLTSSYAAVGYGHARARYDETTTRPFTEEEWSKPEATPSAYPKSKTLAEMAAWEFIRSPGNARGIELATINPSLVVGPPLSANAATSVDIAVRLLSRQMPAVPKLALGVVDVRDVAQAHVAAMTAPGAAGNRFLLTRETIWMRAMGEALAAEFDPMGYNVPTSQMPNFMLRVASVCDSSLDAILPDLGKWQGADGSKATRELGITYTDFGKSMADMGHALVLWGATERKRGYKPNPEMTALVAAMGGVPAE